MTDFNSLDEETMAQKADEVVKRAEETVHPLQQQPGSYAYSYQPPQPQQQAYTPPQAPPSSAYTGIPSQPQPPQQPTAYPGQQPPVSGYQGQPPASGYQEQQPQYAQYNQQPYGQQPYGQPPYNQGSPYGYQQKSKLVAGLLGILLGGIGIHNFYLGFTTKGIIQIVVTFITCGIGGIWGFVEGILYLCGSMNVDANGVFLKE